MTEPSRSQDLFRRAAAVIPGGVNSPVRAFDAVGGRPLYVERGSGATLHTCDGRQLTDYCGSWGPLILGHARPEVVAAIRTAAEAGTSFGINTPGEVEFAELLCSQVPSIQQVRLVSSGTEAVMTALRLARGVTGRSRILKFAGCYHGHGDSLLVAAGSGLLTGGVSSSAGVTAATAADTLVVEYNDLAAVEAVLDHCGGEIAAIIVEPVAGNMGVVRPEPGFLAGLRQAADRCGAVLIFDEVITGFRLAATTCGELFGIRPDLTCLGKIIGGGLPIGAVGGAAELMRQLAPTGPVYQAGTLSGNPVAVAAGLATLKVLIQENPYPGLAALAERLADGLERAASGAGVELRCVQVGGMFTPFFTGQAALADLAGVKRCRTGQFAEFFRGMLAAGIYLPPSQFETAFISSAHDEADIQEFILQGSRVLKQMKESE